MGTEDGRILGTSAYMSPEQARGRTVDTRTDIWAFGCVLYELLTGRQAFRGETFSDRIAAILERDPDWKALPPATPPRIRDVLQRCLQKDADRRLQDIGDARIELEGALAASSRPRLPRRQLVAMAGIALLVLLVVPLGLNLGGLRTRLLRPIASGRVQSLAVLPLLNLSGDPEQDYFADGMTEALIMDFGQIRSLRVISRTSTMHYKGTRKTLPEIARELRVDAVVEGSVIQSSDRVRVTVQLIEAATDAHLWAKSYDRDLRDVLSLQEEVAQAIATEIKVNLTPEERMTLASARPVNNEAHGLYLRGRFLWGKGTQEGLEKSVEYFQKAIEIDPNYAPAHAGLADAYGQLWFLGDLPPAEGISKAKAAAAKALAINDKLADAHAALGWYLFAFDWDWSAAERELKLATHLNPSYSTAHRLYTEYLWSQGRFDEALSEAKRAVELDPLSLGPSSHIATTFYFARQYDRAIAQQRKTLELDPNFPYSHANIGESLDQEHMFTEAIAEFRKALALERNPKYLAWLGHAYAASGRRDDALQVLSELKATSNQRYVPSYDVALVYAGLGDEDQAIGWLNRAYEEHSRGLCWIKVEPRLDPLRPDPRFQDLLRRVNLQP
jgi:TolB-like protein/Tfp pilus assembly protein PilF